MRGVISTREIVILDITTAGLTVDRRTIPEADLPSSVAGFQLHLPSKQRVLKSPRARFIECNQAEELSQILEQLDASKTTIIFGHASDPFLPFEGKFDISLRILETIATASPQHLIIQTRSPLIVIALPLLKRLGARASVTVALEAFDDRLSIKLAPQLPRPSERMKTARALKRFGVAVTTQVAPLIGTQEIRNAAVQIAQTLQEISTEIRMTSIYQLNQSMESKRQLHAHGFAEAAEDYLLEALVEIAPEKVTLSSALIDHKNPLAA